MMNSFFMLDQCSFDIPLGVKSMAFHASNMISIQFDRTMLRENNFWGNTLTFLRFRKILLRLLTRIHQKQQVKIQKVGNKNIHFISDSTPLHIYFWPWRYKEPHTTVVDRVYKKKVGRVHYNQHYPRVRTKQLV